MLHQVVLELVALAVSAFDRIPRRFCANFLNLPDFHLRVKLDFCPLGGRSNSLLTVDPHWWIRLAEKEKVLFRSIAQRKISKSDQQTAPEPLRLTGDKLLGRTNACSLRVSLQGCRGYCLT